MDIALARTFLMVAETGSFIDAARKMNVTQSTVSARIKVLEEQFGRSLFERSRNGATLTGAGLLLLAVQRRITAATAGRLSSRLNRIVSRLQAATPTATAALVTLVGMGLAVRAAATVL